MNLHPDRQLLEGEGARARQGQRGHGVHVRGPLAEAVRAEGQDRVPSRVEEAQELLRRAAAHCSGLGQTWLFVAMTGHGWLAMWPAFCGWYFFETESWN